MLCYWRFRNSCLAHFLIHNQLCFLFNYMTDGLFGRKCFVAKKQSEEITSWEKCKESFGYDFCSLIFSKPFQDLFHIQIEVLGTMDGWITRIRQWIGNKASFVSLGLSIQSFDILWVKKTQYFTMQTHGLLWFSSELSLMVFFP